MRGLQGVSLLADRAQTHSPATRMHAPQLEQRRTARNAHDMRWKKGLLECDSSYR